MTRLLSVLIVEDYPDAADSLALLLTLCGCEVRAARDGAQAEECVRLSPPDVLLLDIGLPGEDGYAVAKRLRSLMGRKPLLIAVSGFGQPHDLQRSRDEGFDDHLVKPTDPVRLLNILREFAKGLPCMLPAPHRLTTTATDGAYEPERVDALARLGRQ